VTTDLCQSLNYLQLALASFSYERFFRHNQDKATMSSPKVARDAKLSRKRSSMVISMKDALEDPTCEELAKKKVSAIQGQTVTLD